MKTIDDINIYTWFIERELKYAPVHFLLVKTLLTPSSKEWILENLKGRFAVIINIDHSSNNLTPYMYPAFEDPKEAVFYELAWS